MSIRRAELTDLETVFEVTSRTISHDYPHYYAKGAVEFFLEHHSRDRIAGDIRQGAVWLCCHSGQQAVGTITWKGNGISRLFVLPEYQKKGYGRELLDYAEREILKAYDKIILDASLPAKIMYRKRGYREIESNVIPVKYGDFLCYDVMYKQR